MYITYLNGQCSLRDDEWKLLQFPIIKHMLDIIAMRYPYDKQKYSHNTTQYYLML
jgi:hypothetical protein